MKEKMKRDIIYFPKWQEILLYLLKNDNISATKICLANIASYIYIVDCKKRLEDLGLIVSYNRGHEIKIILTNDGLKLAKALSKIHKL